MEDERKQAEAEKMANNNANEKGTSSRLEEMEKRVEATLDSILQKLEKSEGDGDKK